MKHKLIGVTARFLTHEGTEREFVNRNYIDALLRYNCNTILLMCDNPNLEEVLDLCDGFLVTGGSDIDPKFFGEVNNGESEEVMEELDILDKQVIEYAVKTKKPLLGICRGHQSINVFLGGSLNQDIGKSHSDIKNGHVITSIKNDVLNFDPVFEANSYHHQTLKKVAPGLKVICMKDDVVEAVVHESLPIIGVQWHPERLMDSKESKMIFDKFFSYMK